jgi:hypothetical protein
VHCRCRCCCPIRWSGAINVYAHDKDVFDEHAAEFGELFAKPAAVAVHNAQILAQAMALAVQLQTALSTRPVIDQTVGLLRGHSGRREDAFACCGRSAKRTRNWPTWPNASSMKPSAAPAPRPTRPDPPSPRRVVGAGGSAYG